MDTGRVGDRVWLDLNRDGIQDLGEPGLVGAVVTIDDGMGNVEMDTTVLDGSYGFTELPAGDFIVTVDVSMFPGLVPAPCNVGGDDEIDNDCSPAAVTLPTNDSADITIDFGFTGSGCIGDFVWHDLNRDGIQDAGEPGLQGIVIRLKDANGATIEEVTTDGNGAYAFENLFAGNYTVEVDESTLPPNFMASPCQAGSDPALDNNCSPAMVNLADDGAQDKTIDFGFESPCTGAIGDFVWNDLDCDGIQDAGEPGIEFVELQLFDEFDNLIAMQTTGPMGEYSFAGLCAGTYKVEVDLATLPPDYVASPCMVGMDPALDNDCSPVTVMLAADDTVDDTIDFGFNSPCKGKIGDFLWHDNDMDGIQDPSEPGIDGILILLKDDLGTTLAQTTTGPNGAYGFTGLCAGTYTIEVDESTLPPGFMASPCDVGMDDTVDSDCSPVTVTLATDDARDCDVDFGYYSECVGIIGDFVWRDDNGNGLQDPMEDGIKDVLVSVKDVNGVVVTRDRTDENGFYQLTGLCAGTYTVEYDPTSLPPGLAPTICNAGTDPTIDSDCIPVTVVLPTNDTVDNTIDFGFVNL